MSEEITEQMQRMMKVITSMIMMVIMIQIMSTMMKTAQEIVTPPEEEEEEVLFSDDFNDNSIDTDKWSVFKVTEELEVVETNQRLEITCPATDAGGGLQTKDKIDVANRTVTVDIGVVSGEPSFMLRLSTIDWFVDGLQPNRYDINIHRPTDSLQFKKTIGGTVTVINSISPIPPVIKKLRFVISGGTVTAQYYDGVAWQTIGSESWSLSSTEVYVLLIASGDPERSGVAYFDNFYIK